MSLSRLLKGFFLLLVLLAKWSQSFAYELPLHFYEERVLSNLSRPTYLLTLPNDEMLLLQKGGDILLFDPAESPTVTRVVLLMPDVDSSGERGLSSAVLDPDFQSNGYIYLYYQHLYNDDSTHSRIIRLTFEDYELSMDGSVVVWESNEASSDCCHYGGGLDFGPDGMLYLTTGEEFQPEQSQDLTRNGGKILRLDVAGVSDATPWVRNEHNDHIIPSDNPSSIADGPGGNLDEIWAYGLRNPYRAYWDIPSEQFYIGDVGGNVRLTAIESLEVGQAGANFGWPVCEGLCSDDELTYPLYSYPHTNIPVWRGAIIGGPVYRATMFPEYYYGALFIADFARENISYLKFDGNGNLESTEDLIAEGVSSPVSLEVGPDGGLYVVNFLENTVTRYVYTTNRVKPTISSATASVLQGPPPLSVDFSADATVNGDAQLEYSWVFGDDNSALGSSATHTYTQIGTYEAYAVVVNDALTATSEPIFIRVGTAPEPQILLPAEDSFFQAGESVVLSAEAIDDEGILSDDQFLWDIEFLHDEHAHPVVELTGREAEYTIPTSGHDYFGNTGYRINLTATDSDGLAETISVDIVPDKVDIDIDAFPQGINVLVDGLPFETPVVYDTLIGFDHVIAAEQQVCFEGMQYEYVYWSDGGGLTHSLTVPPQGMSLAVHYEPIGVCEVDGVSIAQGTDTGATDTASSALLSAPIALVQSIFKDDASRLTHSPDTLITTEQYLVSASKTEYALSVFDRDEYTGQLSLGPQIQFEPDERLSVDYFAPTGALGAIDDKQFVALGEVFEANECAPGDSACGISTIATFEISNGSISIVDSIERDQWVETSPNAVLTVAPNGNHLYEAMQQNFLPGFTAYSVKNDLSMNRISNNVEIAVMTSSGVVNSLDFNAESSLALVNRLTPTGSVLSVLTRDDDSGELSAVADYDVANETGFRNINAIALSPSGKNIYATLSLSISGLNDAIGHFEIDENGLINLLSLNSDASERHIDTFSNPSSMVLNQDAQLLYVSNDHSSELGAQAIHVYNTDEALGLSYLNSYVAGNNSDVDVRSIGGISNIVLSPDDAFLYVTAEEAISVFAVHADLRVEASSPQTVLVGTPISASFRVYNGGPAIANKVRLSVTSTNEISAVSNNEDCRIAGISVVCELGQLLEGESIDVNIITSNSELTDNNFTAAVTQLQTDLIEGSNTVSVVTRSVADQADLVGITGMFEAGCSVGNAENDQLLMLLLLLSAVCVLRKIVMSRQVWGIKER